MSYVLPKHLTAWLCGLISTDGYITRKKNQTTRNGCYVEVCVATTGDEKWANNISCVLEKENVKVSVNKYFMQGRGPPHWIFKVYLFRINNGADQYELLLRSIEHWELSSLILPRKLKVLSNFIRNKQAIEPCSILKS